MPLRNKIRTRSGAVAPLVALLVVVLLGMLAFAIDIGYIALTVADLQSAADASAVAAANVMQYDKPASAQSAATKAAKDCAAANMAGGKTVSLADADVEYGYWDEAKRSFSKNTSPYNAVRVLARRDSGNANGALPLFFGKLLGMGTTDVSAESIALVEGGGIGCRFLLDDEMFDTDVKAIENIAKAAKKSTDTVLGDANGDWFIDLYKYVTPGQTIELPTGQVGDEAMFDIEATKGTSYGQFPFTATSKPSFKDFLNYNEDSSSWRYDLIKTSQLDPVKGVGRWNDPNKYASLVNPDFVHVSPVFRSDVSALDSVGAPVKNGVNALGLRRGLVAFKIVGVGADPDGKGSVLPNLIIELVDPSTINLDQVSIGLSSGGGRPRLVR